MINTLSIMTKYPVSVTFDPDDMIWVSFINIRTSTAVNDDIVFFYCELMAVEASFFRTTTILAVFFIFYVPPEIWLIWIFITEGQMGLSLLQSTAAFNFIHLNQHWTIFEREKKAGKHL